jgi:hypothetical protein
MREIKTVEHNGKVLQIGQRYEFSDRGNAWSVFVFDGLTGNPARPYGAYCTVWKLIRTIDPRELGTLERPSVDLVHGAAYSFKINGTSYVGLYSKNGTYFATVEFDVYDVDNATNIKRLFVEIES